MSERVHHERLARERRVRVEPHRGRFDALAVLAAQPARETLFYMERPDAAEAIVAIGEVATIRAHGEARFALAADETARVFAELRSLSREMLQTITHTVLGRQ